MKIKNKTGKYGTATFNIFNGDCLEVMDELIKNNIVVDAIITDPPYGLTALDWDIAINIQELIPRLYKLLKGNGRLILFGNSPFYDKLMVDLTKLYNLKSVKKIYFKYSQELIWEKNNHSNPITVNTQLARKHEKIMILNSNKQKENILKTYNPYTKILEHKYNLVKEREREREIYNKEEIQKLQKGEQLISLKYKKVRNCPH